MRSTKPMIVIMLLITVIGISLLINRRSARQDERYDELVSSYECYPWPCVADFNGNGTSDRLEVIQTKPSDKFDAWLVVSDGEQELFRRPYVGMDNTLRTHSGIRTDADGVHLLIFDGTNGPGKHVNAVYLWNGERMAEVAPSNLDREILSAMAARDDSGGWPRWVAYRLMRDGYFLLLTIITVVVTFYYGFRNLIRR